VSRADLNEHTALLTSTVLSNGRREAFVIDGDVPEGINVHERNYAVVDASAAARASAYNQLGAMFTHAERWSLGMDAFEAALHVASTGDDARGEGCDALSFMAWTALRMNHKGVDFKGDDRAGATTRIFNSSMDSLFHEMLHDESVVAGGTVHLGAGHVPTRPDPVLLVSVSYETKTDETKTDETKTDETKTDETTDETKTDETKTDETTRRPARYFFYDDSAKCVRECSAQPSEP
jgi:hypothetical protein